jgi:hypothetical protein
MQSRFLDVKKKVLCPTNPHLFSADGKASAAALGGWAGSPQPCSWSGLNPIKP